MQINRNKFWSRSNYFCSNFTNNSKPLEKPTLLRTLQSQFDCGIYVIVQLLSLKLPLDSQYIQATSLKIFLFQKLGETSLFTLSDKVPL